MAKKKERVWENGIKYTFIDDIEREVVSTNLPGRNRKLYLAVNKDNGRFYFHFSAGAKSDRTITGYLTECENFEDAKTYMDSFIPLWLKKDGQGMADLAILSQKKEV